MLSTIKNVFLFLLIITIAVGTGIFIYSANRTYLNNEKEVGNTTGNIYNGGLFCEKNGKIYFSNDADNGSLYVMDSNLSNMRFLHPDKAVYINADENYVYYVRANYSRDNNSGSIFVYNNAGVYRVKQNGTNLKVVSNSPGAYLTLSGNYLYYQHYDVEDGLFLYSNKIDLSGERPIIREAVIPSAVINNKLYYAGYEKDHNIDAVDLTDGASKTSFEGSYVYPVFYGGYIYYLDASDDYKLYRMKQDGSKPTLLVKERCSTYNITTDGKYLFYQVDNGKKNRICRMDLKTKKSETILKGVYKEINVTKNYIFFKDFNDKNTYVISAFANSKVSTFHPKDLTK